MHQINIQNIEALTINGLARDNSLFTRFGNQTSCFLYILK